MPENALAFQPSSRSLIAQSVSRVHRAPVVMNWPLSNREPPMQVSLPDGLFLSTMTQGPIPLRRSKIDWEQPTVNSAPANPKGCNALPVRGGARMFTGTTFKWPERRTIIDQLCQDSRSRSLGWRKHAGVGSDSERAVIARVTIRACQADRYCRQPAGSSSAWDGLFAVFVGLVLDANESTGVLPGSPS